MRGMKDKLHRIQKGNVLHEGDEGQIASDSERKCPS